MAPSGSGAASFFDSGIRKALRATISLGNLEGTLATGGSSKCGPSSSDCFAFRAPPSYSAALKRAGFTIMNLANNHALDYGETGQAETIAALKRAGLRFTGRPGEIAVLRRGGTKVAFVGFAPYPWAQSLLDIDGRREARTGGRPQGGRRRRDDARGRRRVRRAARAARAGVVPRRAARQRRTRSRTPSSAPAPISSSATARTSSAGSSGIAGE